jgi:3-methyladenine DNA glycosylase AlkD
MTTATRVLSTLKKLGKPQTAVIYKRYGTGDNVFGVLTSELVKLQKKIKVDHALAKQLWKTGNAEARILSLLVSDPAKVTRADADALVKQLSSPFLAGYVAGLVARSPIADKVMYVWMKAKAEYVRSTGYSVFASRLKDDEASVSDADAVKLLATIEKELAGSPNWARYAMNNAVIAIGVFKPALRKQAIAAARRIGTVDVDHGETHCETPDAATYIEKAAKRRR